MLNTRPALPRTMLFFLALPGILLCMCLSCPARADSPSPENSVPAAAPANAPDTRLNLPENGQSRENPTAEASEESPCEYRSYAMLCMANAYPGLESEQLIPNLFDPLMSAIAPRIEEVNTFSNMRDNHLLWVPNVGGGYNITRHLSLFLQLGYGAGPVHTEDRAPSLFLLPLDLFFEMKRSAFTVTPGIDYFPFGMVEQRDYHGLMERLRAIRPTLGVRVPWTHAAYQAHVKLGLGPFDKLVNIRLGDSWNLWSANLNVGFDLPVNRRNQVNINLGRSFFFGRDSDFGGTVFSVTWKYLL